MARPHLPQERNKLAWDLYQQGKSYDEIFEQLVKNGYNKLKRENLKVLIHNLKQEHQPQKNLNKEIKKELNKELIKERKIKHTNYQLFEDQARFIKSHSAEKGYKVSEFLRRLLDKEIKRLKEGK